MKRITYLACTLITASFVAAMIGWSMAAGNFFVPLIAIPLGVIVVLACRQNVNEKLEDERTSRIRSKAALRTLEVLVIAGAIATVILYSYVVSSPLSPSISGRVYSNADGTSSMTINLYKPGSPSQPENLIRSSTIRNINAMNESEAEEYCTYVRESYRENEDRGLIGMTVGSILIVLMATFGAFYHYSDKKY
jgi:uncharacterized membrane protein